MLNIFKKDNNIYAPVSGVCKKIEDSKDKTFSTKVLGNGFLVEPNEGYVYSPCKGKIISVFPTYHAFGFELSNGVQILLHIGVNTVKLQKGSLKSTVRIGEKVNVGTKLVTFDLDEMKKNNIDMSVAVIVINEKDVNLEKIDTSVKYGELIINDGGRP